MPEEPEAGERIVIRGIMLREQIVRPPAAEVPFYMKAPEAVASVAVAPELPDKEVQLAAELKQASHSELAQALKEMGHGAYDVTKSILKLIKERKKAQLGEVK